MYKDAALTERLSGGGGANPDEDTYNGTYGQSHDRQLFLANEQVALAEEVDASATTLTLQAPAFSDDETIIVDAEQMKVLSGGGTTSITLTRGYAGTTAASHAAGAIVYSGYNYSEISVAVVDMAGIDESSWYSFAVTQAGLADALPGEPLQLADKTYTEVLSFWRRCTVPPDTPVQNKTDLRMRVSGVEHPIP
jgi:hypothetical protein